VAAEYLLTSSFEPIVPGQSFAGQLPRHVTIQQYFKLSGSEQAFKHALTNLTTRFYPIEVTGGQEALYGPNNDVPVRLLHRLGALARLHNDTLELVNRFGGTMRNPEWAGAGYNPHVTYVDGRALEEGETATLRNLELIVRKDGEGQKIAELVLPLSKK